MPGSHTVWGRPEISSSSEPGSEGLKVFAREPGAAGSERRSLDPPKEAKGRVVGGCSMLFVMIGSE